MSTQPGKERKKHHNLPAHQRKKRLTAHLSEELLLKYNRRSLPVRAGDTVRIMRGDFKGTTGEVLEVDPREGNVTVENATMTKADSTEVAKAVSASNVLITKLDLSDRRRADKLGASQAAASQEDDA